MNNLKLTRPMMHGAAVRRIQEFLDMPLQDGIFGKLTERAVKAFQKRALLTPDGIVGPKTRAVIKGARTEFGVELFDARDMHPKPRNFARKRKWSAIVGVLLHQTGCDMPNHPINCGKINAHYLVMRSGTVAWMNDETDFIWHGQGLSSKTIGIEFEGNFPGIAGDPSTLWRGGGPGVRLNREQIQGALILFEHLRLQFCLNSAQWSNIFAHRQSSNTRIADPGSDIWKKIALPWAEALNLKNADGGDMFRVGKGLPIPRAWDPERRVVYR